ncbi:DUF2490 domain-containing protein [Spirosoma agri]|uniref:DUF2490 domain-containing protein n=1 Tax=Spirosoma agri TaxID=1987381 RepID=A0A6M0II64_9BACT|nr:DUF2490 domain-containing protein [Spirosoma agri]NEU67884.1 DUF2490 domain-containing protein [Spirosoma agri]
MGKILIFVSLLMAGVLSAFSQDRYMAGTLPQANINFSLSNDVKLNVKLESRQIISERTQRESGKGSFRYERTDLGLVLTKKVSINSTLGGGYLIRLEDNQLVHRFIQQANWVNDLNPITVAHRLVIDETFRKTDPTEIRLRYRLGLERALSGRQIDPKELYVKLQNEYLGIWSAAGPDLEIRASTALGYNATDDNQIELGFEYRVNEFNQPSKAHQYWTTISWFVSI